MFEIEPYRPSRAEEWNQFVARSKNGTFLFDRNYMDYHSERFCDHSLMVFRRGRLYALLPGNVEKDTYFSHGGLTYGGLLTDDHATGAEILTLFGLLNKYLRAEGLSRVVYKPTPWIYHRCPSEEDLYALIQACNARLVARSLSSAIVKSSPAMYRIRTAGAVHAQRDGITVGLSNDWETFWHILSDNLQTRYHLRPVHTLDEIKLLHSRFPEQIKLFAAYDSKGRVLGGTVLFFASYVAHSQYIAATTAGKKLHVLDLLFTTLIHQCLAEWPVFDFGISTEHGGTFLNESLLYQKEGFGGRAVCYDT